jgi:hypothetical protein
MAFFCACTDVTDALTAFRLFYKPVIHIFTHSELQLHTVLSYCSDKLGPQGFLTTCALTRVFSISLLLSKKSRQQSHHHLCQCAL